MNRLLVFLVLASLTMLTSCDMQQEPVSPGFRTMQSADAAQGRIGINVLLNQSITSELLTDLEAHGTILNTIPQLKAVIMRSTAEELTAIQQKPYVVAANPDAVRQGIPLDAVPVADFAAGINTWNLDAINVTNLNQGRVIAQDGSGVYIGVLDTGLLDSWRQYFPQERIAVQYARAYSGGGGDMGRVSEVPNQWEHDQNSHGTHVTSTIMGFNIRGTYVNGAAPKATVIPVKVLNQAGFGWTSIIAQGMVYIADLKAGPLKNHPVIINMSLGGSQLDAIEKAAIDYAVGKGVILVASAGNSGQRGMGYPAAYEPVISVASSGFIRQFLNSRSWWVVEEVQDPTNTGEFFISDFSSRPRPDQDLDVTAPGEYVVGPYQLNSGKLSYYFLSGTSMASPHVAGIVALMAQKNPGLNAAAAEDILESVAIPLAAGSRQVYDIFTKTMITVAWEENASGHGLITADAAVNATP